MSRPSRNVKNTEPLAVIDLTQDSPANAALRRSRIRSVDAESSIIECGEINTVKVSSNPVGEHLKVKKRRNKAAVVINLDETVNLDNTPTNTNLTQPQAVLPEPPAKKELLTCPICFENLADGNTQAMTTPCGHIFCLDCLNRIVKEKKKCSLCQKEIKKSHCIRLHI